MTELQVDVLSVERSLLAPLTTNLANQTLGYQRQRAVRAAGGSWRDVVVDQWRRFRTDVGGPNK
jgi:hypothetical protein